MAKCVSDFMKLVRGPRSDVPSEIEVFGDLSKRQTQGLEHTNKLRKGKMKGATNRHKQHATGTVLAHVLVRYKTRKMFDDGKVVVRNEKMKARRVRRAQAKIERLKLLDPWLTRGGSPNEK
jgi:hypothetical protein